MNNFSYGFNKIVTNFLIIKYQMFKFKITLIV